MSVFVGAGSFLLLPILTKYLTPEDYGVISIFNASVRFFGIIITLGIGNVLWVYFVHKNQKFNVYFKAFIEITFFISIVFSILIAGSYFFMDKFFGLPISVAIFLPFVALLVIYYETTVSYFVYIKQFSSYAKLTISKFFIEITLIVCLVVIFPFNWKGRVMALVVSLVIMFGFSLYLFIRKGVLKMKIKTRYSYKHLVFKGFPLMFLGLSIVLMNLSDRFFIEYFVGLEATGYYGIASFFSGIILMITGAAMNVLRPLIYENLKSEDTDKLKWLTIGYVIGLFLITILVYLITPFIFKFMIDEQFQIAFNLVLPLIVGMFFWGTFNYFISFFMYRKKNIVVGSISLLGIFINLGLNYLFVLKFGTIGAAYATLITYFLLSLLIVIFYIFTFKTHRLNDF